VLTFTPDSRYLYYSTNEHSEFQQAWSYDLSTGKRDSMVKADWDVWYVYFSENGRYRVLNALPGHETPSGDLSNPRSRRPFLELAVSGQKEKQGSHRRNLVSTCLGDPPMCFIVELVDPNRRVRCKPEV